MPFADFVSKHRQAVPLSITYSTGGAGIKGFTQFIDYSAKGDYYNASLEIIRSDRSETVKGRALWEALIYLTDGDPSLTGEGRLDDYKRMVEAELKTQRNKGKNAAQVMEELFISEAARLGYGPKTE